MRDYAASIALCHAGEVLLVHRNDGTWSFPGGRSHPEESPLQTALRELSEEVGLELIWEGRLMLPGFDQRQVVPAGSTPTGDAHYLVILTVEEKPGTIHLQESELQGFGWFRPEVAAKREDLHHGMEEDLKRLMLNPRVYLS